MNGYDKNKEIREAIVAGERAVRSLKDAEASMRSAGNWGLLDLFGGNMISGLMKHSKINNASNEIKNAQRDLQMFETELRDIKDIQDLNVDIGGFLTFADFFFDGFLADIVVQSKIDGAKRKVRDAISRTQLLVDSLKRSLPQ